MKWVIPTAAIDDIHMWCTKPYKWAESCVKETCMVLWSCFKEIYSQHFHHLILSEDPNCALYDCYSYTVLLPPSPIIECKIWKRFVQFNDWRFITFAQRIPPGLAKCQCLCNLWLEFTESSISGRNWKLNLAYHFEKLIYFEDLQL